MAENAEQPTTSSMRKDYFSKILEIHIETRFAEISSFCELHDLTSDHDNHNSIFCNLADWDDSFTGLIEILVLKEKLLQDVKDEEYLSFLKVAIPSYLYWMNVLRENLTTLNHLASKNKDLKIEVNAWRELMPKIQSIGAWTNFHKHPRHILKIHHPRIIFSGNDDEIKSYEFVFDCTTAKDFFGCRPSEQEIKNSELDALTATHTHWVIKYPDLIELHACVMRELDTYLSSIKNKILHDQAYKKWIECLYNKSWAEIQD